MITIWKTPIVATVEQVLKDLKLQLYGAGLLKEIKNTGSDLMCTCPFHANGKEHNPSCGVLLQQKVTKDKTYEAGTVHCYTCGYTADLPQFVADLLGLSSPVEEKKIQIMDLLSYAIGIPEMKYFNLDSDELLDEKIEVLTQIKEGKTIAEIPNFYKVLEDLPEDDVWD